MMPSFVRSVSLLCFSVTLPAQSEDLRYPSGDLELAAELLIPDGIGPFPAAVILQGSGDSDRSNSWAAGIAQLLRDTGLAVLLTDKRGCGASEGDWTKASFEELAGDALAGVACLQEHEEVDQSRIGLVGLSQGGWVAPIAAARSEDVAWVINISGAAVSFAEQVTVEMANTARQAGLGEDSITSIVQLNSAAGRYAISGDWEAYETLRTQAMQGEARPVAEGFPATREHPTWDFVRGVGDFDPMPYWSMIRQPVLVLYGEEDEADNVPVLESVRRLEFSFAITGKSDGKIVVIPGAGHGFVQNGRLMKPFVEALEDWLLEIL